MATLVFTTLVDDAVYTAHIEDTPQDFNITLFTPEGVKVEFELTPPLYKQLLEEAFYASFAEQRGIDY